MLTSNLKNHLLSRGCEPEKYRVIISEELGIATFYLFTFTGKMMGYQTYNPSAPKTRNNCDPKLQKYYTYISKNEYGKSDLAFWGIDRYDSTKKDVYLCEGIFDAIKLHNLGLNAFALLANDPKRFYSMLHTLPHRYIAMCDGDEAGKKLAKMGHIAITMPEGRDLGAMEYPEIVELLKKNNLI